MPDIMDASMVLPRYYGGATVCKSKEASFCVVQAPSRWSMQVKGASAVSGATACLVFLI